MTLYIKVTNDELELPEAVADSAAELARMVGCSVNCIYSTISHVKRGKIKRGQYMKVEIDE